MESRKKMHFRKTFESCNEAEFLKTVLSGPFYIRRMATQYKGFIIAANDSWVARRGF